MTAPVRDGEPDAGELLAQVLGRLARVLGTGPYRAVECGAGPVLAHLVETGPQRAGALARRVGTDPSAVSRQVAALVTAGLVERSPDPVDGRARLLAATAAGRHRCAEGRRRRAELVAAVLSGWPDGSRRQLAELLTRFVDAAAQERDRALPRRSGGES